MVDSSFVVAKRFKQAVTAVDTHQFSSQNCDEQISERTCFDVVD